MELVVIIAKVNLDSIHFTVAFFVFSEILSLVLPPPLIFRVILSFLKVFGARSKSKEPERVNRTRGQSF